MDNIYLSVIIPAYNEENRIGRTLLDINRYLSKKNILLKSWLLTMVQSIELWRSKRVEVKKPLNDVPGIMFKKMVK